MSQLSQVPIPFAKKEERYDLNASLLAERIPHAELYIVQGGRHGYMIEFREEADRVINDFLARHPLH